MWGGRSWHSCPPLTTMDFLEWNTLDVMGFLMMAMDLMTGGEEGTEKLGRKEVKRRGKTGEGYIKRRRNDTSLPVLDDAYMLQLCSKTFVTTCK